MTRQRKQINVAPDAQPVAKPETPDNQAQDKRAEAEAELFQVQRLACELAGRDTDEFIAATQRKYRAQIHYRLVSVDGGASSLQLFYTPAPLNQ
jgi:hypothetical protein